jgi:exopolysaccharide biosynthesis polyprenyl glycosylphosphotransferase
LLYPDDSKIYVYGCEDEFEKLNLPYMTLSENTNPRLDDIVVIGQNKIDDNLSRALIHYKLMGGNVLKFTDFYERQFLKIPLDYFKSTLDIIMLTGFNKIKRKEQMLLKRLLDVVMSALLLIVLSPILVVTGIFIKLDSKGPVFYRQIRTGEGGRSFTIYKFRSMVVDAEKMGAKWADKNDPRITKVGRFIRKTRIDELPQLINIVKGEMSFVGPRPERPEFDNTLSEAIPFWMLRYIAKPGLTGWAQINYDYGASLEDAKEKLKYDMYYIKNFSFYLDIKIIVNTLKVIFFGKGR